jgi:small subunit ribosomal protein S16
MVAIRLSRVGKKNHTTFRIVVSDRRKDTVGKYLELLGTCDPHQNPAKVEVNVERAKHWLSVGAKPSDTVYNLFVDQGIISGDKLAIKRAKTVKEEPAPVGTPEATPAAAPAEATK